MKDALQRIPNIVQFLRDVLVSGRSEHDMDTTPALKECYQNGWLQAELLSGDRTVYIFPTKIHQWYKFSFMFPTIKLRLFLRYAERLLCTTAQPLPKNRFGSVKDLCFAAVREFSRVSLSSVDRGIGPGAVKRPVEAQYQDEFYRACHSELKVYLTSEWSGSSLAGRVDFRIKEMKWVIECVREGERFDEHIGRFQPGGRYYKWIMSGEVKDYIILDFRTSMPQKVRGMVVSFCSSDEC
jgi:hypothetical protein